VEGEARTARAAADLTDPRAFAHDRVMLPDLRFSISRSRVAAVVLAVLSIAVLSANANGAPAHSAGVSPFVGHWGGHGRSLVVHRNGIAHETIYDGCCTRVIDLRLRVSHAHGTVRRGRARVRVLKVSVHRKDYYSKSHPAPHRGQTGRLRLRRGVITTPITDTNYCNRAAGNRGVCGA
jgi:hypothetical protein